MPLLCLDRNLVIHIGSYLDAIELLRLEIVLQLSTTAFDSLWQAQRMRLKLEYSPDPRSMVLCRLRLANYAAYMSKCGDFLTDQWEEGEQEVCHP